MEENAGLKSKIRLLFFPAVVILIGVILFFIPGTHGFVHNLLNGGGVEIAATVMTLFVAFGWYVLNKAFKNIS